MNCRSRQHQFTLYPVFLFATMTLMAITMAEAECLPCVHGICDGSRCRCQEGYGGVLCDECVPSEYCVHGYCINPGGCKCKPGWSGMFCNVDSKGYCHYNTPCMNGGTCSSLGKQGFTCTCAKGYSGIRCQNWINGPCSCKNNGVCVESRDGSGCLCPIDYDGEHCEHFTGRCAKNVCPTNSTCVHTGTGYRCDCKVNQCEPTLMQCTESSCQDGLQCSKKPGQLGFMCECLRGTAGRGCDMRPLCIVMGTCLNGGQCFETLNNVMCVCNDVYSGIRCETKRSKCEYNPCANNGSCVVGTKGYFCQCRTGYIGKYCDCKLTSDENCGIGEPTNGGCTLRSSNYNWNQILLQILLVIHILHTKLH